MTQFRLYSNLSERRRRRRKRVHLADAIDEVAEEEARGADEELLPPGAVREGDAQGEENEGRIRSMAGPAGCAG